MAVGKLTKYEIEMAVGKLTFFFFIHGDVMARKREKKVLG